MLKPALLYKEQLDKKELESWNDMSKMWWHGGPYRYRLNLEAGTDKGYGTYDYACVNEKDEVIGFLSYFIDWQVKSVMSFGLVSYLDTYNITLMKDCLTKINELFFKNNVQRISWRCYADNPFVSGYRKFIKEYGGREVGIEHRVSLLEDGQLHDSVTFEILKEDFKP